MIGSHHKDIGQSKCMAHFYKKRHRIASSDQRGSDSCTGRLILKCKSGRGGGEEWIAYFVDRVKFDPAKIVSFPIK